MTANDFYLLFIAFGGFLVVPALLLWGFMRLSNRRPDATPGPGDRPGAGTPDGPTGPKPAERADESPDFSRRVIHRAVLSMP